tara:strand:- start:49 stop:387 length:339 start_codon:yes stop_codon:yes gene_type:complete
MKKEISKTEILVNELILEKYKPVMVIQLSRNTTNKLSNKLKEWGEDISKQTGYEVLVFPDEKDTSVKIVSVYGTEMDTLENINEYIEKKDKPPRLKNTPFTTIKDIIKNKDE